MLAPLLPLLFETTAILLDTEQNQNFRDAIKMSPFMFLVPEGLLRNKVSKTAEAVVATDQTANASAVTTAGFGLSAVTESSSSLKVVERSPSTLEGKVTLTRGVVSVSFTYIYVKAKRCEVFQGSTRMLAWSDTVAKWRRIGDETNLATLTFKSDGSLLLCGPGLSYLSGFFASDNGDGLSQIWDQMQVRVSGWDALRPPEVWVSERIVSNVEAIEGFTTKIPTLSSGVWRRWQGAVSYSKEYGLFDPGLIPRPSISSALPLTPGLCAVSRVRGLEAQGLITLNQGLGTAAVYTPPKPLPTTLGLGRSWMTTVGGNQDAARSIGIAGRVSLYCVATDDLLRSWALPAISEQGPYAIFAYQQGRQPLVLTAATWAVAVGPLPSSADYLTVPQLIGGANSALAFGPSFGIEMTVPEPFDDAPTLGFAFLKQNDPEFGDPTLNAADTGAPFNGLIPGVTTLGSVNPTVAAIRYIFEREYANPVVPRDEQSPLDRFQS